MVIKVKKDIEEQKPLGRYLIEGGFIDSEQLKVALAAQRSERRRLGEILVRKGWIRQQTLDYLIEKVVLPERSSQKKLRLIQKDDRHQLDTVETKQQTKIPRQKLEIPVSPYRTTRLLFYIAVILLGAHLVGQFTEHFLPDYFSRDFIAELFNLDRELNIPTLYAMGLLLVSSILLAIIARAKHVRGDRQVRYWVALSIIFLGLAIDEITSLHERMTDPLRSAFNASGLLHYTWIVPGIIFVLLCFLAFAKFLKDLPSKTRQLILVAGTIFVSGAIGIEAIGGYYAQIYGEQNMGYAVIAGIEEFFEMLGVIIFIYALLSYIDKEMKGLSVRFEIVAQRISNTQLLHPRG
ncbi:hypothetical protein B1A85_03390 [Chroococcidiopsis sp. TS-821]|nr:hypothetical protein B1A85_03390 [Chroococcidiopsis sp. TS-821]